MGRQVLTLRNPTASIKWPTLRATRQGPTENQFNENMNGILYCRVSSKEQVEGTSLVFQEAACRDFAQSKNVDILKAFIEEGESAKFADRTQLLELLDFCKKNKGLVNVLIVWKIDRFARNVADHFSVKSTLAKYGVQIVSVTEPIDANPEGKLMETILAGFAQFDNDIRAMRTVQGMRRKLQEGIFPWGPPLGYRSSVAANEKKTLPDLPKEPAFSLLKRAFREFATGAHAQSEMGRLMASWGLVGAKGVAFPPQSLHQLFTNSFYAGILVDPWSGEQFQGKHVPLVTREEFARVQGVIARRNHSVAHHKDNDDFPLRSLVRCEDCHQALTGAFSQGRSKSYPYYVCAHKECARRGKSIPAGAVHREFAGFLDEIAPRPELIARIGERIIALAKQNEAESSARQHQRRDRSRHLDNEINELIQMRAQKLITDEEFLIQKKRRDEQRTAVEAQARRRLDASLVQQDLATIMKPLGDLRATWMQLKPSFRSRFNRLVVPGGFVTGRIRTADLGLLFSLFPTSASNVSSVVSLGCVPSNRSIEGIAEEIEAFRDVLSGVEEPKQEPKRRFEHSHRNRPRMRDLNHLMKKDAPPGNISNS